MTLQETKDYTRWLLNELFMILIILFISAIITFVYAMPLAYKEGLIKKPSELVIRTDVDTGCQFYESRNGTLTPRLDGNFNQLGCKE